ncbi:MAG TPA: zf-HC2 domain-containing protein [Rhizomicrobium sp.]|nr:zf-HC2 domain-containing protein [Rhizomicrobium sp.]
MSCTHLLRTQAYLDGELEGTAAAEAEAHIGGCAECQSFTADTAAVSDAIRSSASRHAAPPSLRIKVRERLGTEGAPHRQRGAGNRRSFWFGAAGGAGATALAASLAVLAILPPSADTLSASVVDAHTRALMSGHEIQVASTSHHTVKPWFAGRVPLSPPVADLGSKGFQLIGGRVDEVARAPAAVVVYRHGRHMIDLFAWADRGATLPKEAVSHGYRSVFWKGGDLDFAAVSDMDSAELHKFSALIRNQPE